MYVDTHEITTCKTIKPLPPKDCLCPFVILPTHSSCLPKLHQYPDIYKYSLTIGEFASFEFYISKMV